jgi:hypothetical protein
MASKIKVDTLETANGSGTIALSNQLSGMTTASLPALGSAQMPSGSVLQVVNFSVSDTTGSTSATWADTSTTLAITPSSTSSKILVQANMNGLDKSAANTYQAFRLVRGSTTLIQFEGQAGYTNNADVNSVGSSSTSYLDSPSSTSAVTYKVQMRNPSATATVYIGSSASISTITLMEIQG